MKINCEQFETLMQFYFNDDLKPIIKTAFEEHLFDCKDCRKKYNAFKQIIQDLRNVGLLFPVCLMLVDIVFMNFT